MLSRMLVSLKTLLTLSSTLLLTVSIASCSNSTQTDVQPSPQLGMNLPGPMTSEQQLPAQSQGVYGKVQFLQGNHMPMVDPNSAASQAHPAINSRVWVFSAGVRPEQGPYLSVTSAQNHDKLIGWTTTDADGTFRLGLPTGDYSLLMESDHGLYFNSFVGDGSYAAFTVHPNIVTNMVLSNTENAVF